MKIPECENCHEFFESNEKHIKVPLDLGCGDVICKECLKRLLNESEGEELLCPIPNCKNPKIRKKNIEDFPISNYVIKEINKIFNIKSEEVENCQKYTIITLGNSEVGKTSIFQRLVNNKFLENYQCTIGLQYFIYYLNYKAKNYQLYFADTSGMEKYKTITKNYLQNGDAVLFVYDINNKDSFDSLEDWYKFYKDFGEKEIKGMIIGNKYDLPRKVSLEEASKFAKKYNLSYCEISCKLDKNMKKMVISLLNIISHENYDQLSSSLSSLPSSSLFNNKENHNNKINNDNKSTKLEKNKNDKISIKEKKNSCC